MLQHHVFFLRHNRCNNMLGVCEPLFVHSRELDRGLIKRLNFQGGSQVLIHLRRVSYSQNNNYLGALFAIDVCQSIMLLFKSSFIRDLSFWGRLDISLHISNLHWICADLLWRRPLSKCLEGRKSGSYTGMLLHWLCLRKKACSTDKGPYFNYVSIFLTN